MSLASAVSYVISACMNLKPQADCQNSRGQRPAIGLELRTAAKTPYEHKLLVMSAASRAAKSMIRIRLLVSSLACNCNQYTIASVAAGNIDSVTCCIVMLSR